MRQEFTAVPLKTTSMSVTIPRRQALRVAWLLITEYLRAVRHGSESVTFFVDEE